MTLVFHANASDELKLCPTIRRPYNKTLSDATRWLYKYKMTRKLYNMNEVLRNEVLQNEVLQNEVVSQNEVFSQNVVVTEDLFRKKTIRLRLVM